MQQYCLKKEKSSDLNCESTRSLFLQILAILKINHQSFGVCVSADFIFFVVVVVRNVLRTQAKCNDFCDYY